MREDESFPAGRPPSPSVREFALAALAACLLAVLMTWPIAAGADREIPQDLGDPLVQSWQVAWGGHALATRPLDYFQSNIFWPHRDTLAFSDALIGYAPAGLIGRGARAALIRYNLLFLFAYALAFLGAYLLARELGVSPWGALAAGAAFAYAPWRLSQNGHLHVLSSGGVPLALFLLARGLRRGRPGAVVGGWLVAAWQLSLGFTLGLQLAYLLAILGIVAAVAWLRRGRPPLGRALAGALAAGILLFGGWTALQAGPYLRAARDHPEARRTAAYVALFSPPPRGLLAAPAESRLWGDLTGPLRRSLPWPPEQTLFPGAVTIALAVAGLGAPAYPRKLRGGLAAGTVAAAILSLGFGFAGGRFAYRLLYDFAPGWRAVRTPGRIATLTTLGLALLAAAGADRLAGARTTRLAGKVLVLLPALLLLLEGSGRLPHPEVPAAPPGQRAAPSPQLHLPTGGLLDVLYVFWSVDGFPRLVNGYAAFVPRSLAELEQDVRGFPDAASVRRLRSMGVASVVFHPDLARGTPWEGASARPIEGLRLTREEAGGVVVYRILPER